MQSKLPYINKSIHNKKKDVVWKPFCDFLINSLRSLNVEILSSWAGKGSLCVSAAHYSFYASHSVCSFFFNYDNRQRIFVLACIPWKRFFSPSFHSTLKKRRNHWITQPTYSKQTWKTCFCFSDCAVFVLKLLVNFS